MSSAAIAGTGANLDISVRHEGRDLGFCLRDVLPERRFAIGSDGNTIGRLEFAEQFRRFWLAKTANEEPSLVAIPNLVEFISVTWNDAGRLVPIGWKPENDTPLRLDRGPAQVLSPEQIAARAAIDSERVEIEVIKRLVREGVLTAEQGMEQILGAGSAQAAPAEAQAEEAESPPEATQGQTPDDPAWSCLSARDRQLLRIIGPGLMTRDVVSRAAKATGLTDATVRAYVREARRKVEAQAQRMRADETPEDAA